MSPKRVTSHDVAKAAGVSRTTVSFVLNNVEGVQISEDTRQRVMQTAVDLGYIPDAAAQTLASGRSQSIGLILNRSPYHIATDAYITQIIDVLVDETRARGMRLLLETVEDTHPVETYLHLVGSKRIDGIILSGPRFDDQALTALLEDDFPMVLMGSMPDQRFCYVDVDNKAAAKLATDHLVQQQRYQKIACITNADLSFTAACDRLGGYRQSLEENGLPFVEDLVRHGDFTPESGYEQMKSLLLGEIKPDAVFIASDVVALGSMAAIRDHGLRIPEDISVVGFDDVPFARYFDPPLTTVHLPARAMAHLACSMVMEMISGHRLAERQILLKSELVVRNSSVPTG